MIKQNIFGSRLVSTIRLVLATFLIFGVALNNHNSVANSPSFKKTSVIVSAPSKKDLSMADKDARLDYKMGALSEKEANLYRVIFAAQKKHDWDRADDLIEDVKDLRLIGHVLADRFNKRGASIKEMTSWLKAYSEFPQAKKIYKKAIKAGARNITKPRAPRAWQSGGETDRAANFMPYHLGYGQKLSRKSKNKIRLIRTVIIRGRPTQASKMLQKAVIRGVVYGSARYDLESMIASSYFHHGMKDKARLFARSAAHKNSPLGLWIYGLISWGGHNYKTAYNNFSRLSKISKLTANNKAAANFWAYRSAKALGNDQTAIRHIRRASVDSRSFYGMLSLRLLGKDPVFALGNYGVPKWNVSAQTTIRESHAGWRALALIQVGQHKLAEAELRRLNPRGNSDKKQAMLALASYAKMPALVLKIAYLSKRQGLDSSLYPLLPWTPKEGFHIDRALLFALARQESLFNPNAESSRGAQGLMQIMPATAKGIVRNQPKALAMVRNDKLLDPSFNMALGQKYVRTLSRYPKIGKNLVMILASYNAGPNKAISWLASRDKNDALFFLETIPVKETRHYVARVLSHYWAYRARLGKSVPSLKQMAMGHWPHASLNETASLRVAVR